MRYTRNALGLLNAQYRSVLKKCLLINLGLFALGAGAANAEDYSLKAEDLSTSKNITWKEIGADEYKSDNPNMLKVELSADKTQYFEYTYTQPEGGKVYKERKEGKEGALTGDITADFKDSISNVDGGALSNAAGNTLNISGDFLNNQIDNTGSGNVGGAIYNNGTLSIKGDMIGNHIVRNGDVHGGAIYNVSNNANITEIIGNYIGNYVVSNSSFAYGGAIENYDGAVIGKIEGKFIGNYLISNVNMTKTHFSGGAIFNRRSKIDNINGVFINNFIKNESGISAASGGAILNFDSGAEISIINADFYNNYAYNKDGYSRGGAIESAAARSGDDKQSIHKITGDFIGNYAQSINNKSDGGAISNMKSSINEIKGNFTDNYALGGGRASGGAVNNNTNGIIGSITGDFEGNYAESNGGAAAVRGGALFNTGNITNLTANFSNNHALTNGTFAIGGAVANVLGSSPQHGITKFSGNFSNNFAQTTGTGENAYAQGGAIYNAARMAIDDITGDFIGNYASSETGTAQGGAIYNRGTITIAGVSTFTDNYVEKNGEKTSNAIHNLGTVNFKGTNIVINDAITGENGTIYMISSSDDKTTFNNSVSGNKVILAKGTLKLGHYYSALLNKKYVGTFGDGVDFNVKGGKLTTQDGETNEHNLGNLNLSADLNTSIDVDLNTKTGDTLTGSTKAVAAEGKKILIDNIKVLADGTSHITKVKVADANIKDVMDLANDAKVKLDDNDLNSYLIVYEKDAASGNLKFGQVDALETAVQFENANKAFAMGSDIATDTDLGVLTGESLSISGNGHTIDGAGFGGMTIADNQTVSLNDVTVKGFDGAFAENNGTINLKSDTKSDIDSGIIGNGKINVAGAGEININSDIAANKMTVSGGELNLKNGTELSNVENFVANGGVLNVGDQTLNLKKAEFNDGSTLAVNVKSDGNGLLKAENLTINGGNLKATLGQGIVEKGSKTVTLLESNNTFTNKFADVADNNMYRFEKADKAGDYIISLAKTAEDVSQENGGTQNNAGEAKAWVDGNKFEQGSVSADVANKLADLAQNDGKKFNEALSALAPSDTPEVRTNSVNHNTEMFRAVVTHLDDVSKKKQYGLSSGDAVDGVSVWAKAFGNHAKVDDTSKAYGFKSDGYGATLGIEKQLDDAFKVGLGYSYFYNDIDGFMRDSDVNTHTGFVYGEYRPNNWYTNAIASYGYSKYDENKHVAGDVYKAKYDVDNIGAQVMTGYNANVAKVDVTPEAGLRYNNIHRDNYVDSAGQAVKAETMDVMTAVAGLKVGKDLVSCFGVRSFYWRPEARLAATYDLISDKENAVVSLSNGSGYVVKGQRLNRFGVEAGAGVTFYLSPDVESSVGYEGKFRSHYQDHTGYVSAKYKF